MEIEVAIHGSSIFQELHMSQDSIPLLLSKAVLCERLDISQRTLEYMVNRGEFPSPVRIGKKVYWSDTAVRNWQRKLFASQEAWAP